MPLALLATLVALAVAAETASATSLAFVQHRPALGFEPFDVRAGDIDGDGIQDLVLRGGGGGNVSVARGNGDGTFRAPFVSPPVTWSDGRVGFGTLAVGDVNADARADVVVGTGGWNGINEVAVLLGRSDGSLGPQARFATSKLGAPSDIAIGDLNGDGNGDLVLPIRLPELSESTVSVLLGDGRGGFGRPAGYPAGFQPTRVGLADFNVDGNLDVVVTNTFSDPESISVLLGNGDGTLTAPRPTPLLAIQGAFNMVTADLDADGKPDVAVADSAASLGNARTAVLFGRGDGSFDRLPLFQQHNLGTEGHILATADFNRDGLGDLVVPGLKISMNKGVPYTFSDDVYDAANPQHHVLGNGLFGFPELYFLEYSQTRNITADFDNDGWSDIASIGGPGGIESHVLTVLMNRTASLPPVSLAALTLDADTVPGNTTSGGTVTLAAPAPPGGAIVDLATTEPFVITGLPSRVTLAEGQSTARFSFGAAGLHPDFSPAQLRVTIIAQLRNVTKTAPITVLTPGGKPPDFWLEASPASLTIIRGGASASTAVTIVPRSGFRDQVTLTLSGVPVGVAVTPAGPVTVSRDDRGIYPPTSFTFAATSTAKAGNYTVTITGTGSGGLSRSTTLKLQVKRN
jgi:hypothetical protein